uniref:Uncharacterized protein n=1 Tax=Aegilops tauschii subsp. strangulata TaxID=200361 RepID=A0A452ZS90_AEGTS
HFLSVRKIYLPTVHICKAVVSWNYSVLTENHYLYVILLFLLYETGSFKSVP